MRFTLLIPLAFCLSCYTTPQVEGFDRQAWESAVSCDDDRLSEGRVLLAHEEQLLSSNQNEIQALLGSPSEHELYSRNQKFFYYDLRPVCDTLPGQRLSIRFDALGRVNEIQIIKVFE